MNLDHRIVESWKGSGTYLCKCGASIEAGNEDKLRWGLLDHCVDHAEKQARAEVLAACISGARVYFDDFRDVPPPPITIEEVIRFLRGVQPAAKALEELRLRSYRDGATGAAVWFVKLLHGHSEDPPEMGCKPEAISEKLEELLREFFLDPRSNCFHGRKPHEA